MKKKLVIFDLDGTLVNAYRAVWRSLNYALKETGLPRIDHYSVQRNVGRGETKLIRSLVPESKVKKVLRLYRAHHKEALKHGVHFIPYAKGILNRLHRQGYPMAIASNRPTRFTRIIMRELEMRSYFKYVICADRAPRAKPHPDILQMALQHFDRKPSEAVYVGDMTIDAISGRRARIKTVIVTTGSSLKREVLAEKPYKVIDRLDKFWPILKELE
ncbi:MAG: HAD family hydrolase [Candidatus Omnitrophica bacterium]|nr:HAD family hydrolase [Candidatus Omnitrophota bacterium]